MAALRHQLEIIANRQRSVVTLFHERLDKLSDAQLRWAPDAKTWSIVFIIDHLIKVHVATSPVFMRALVEAPPAGDEGAKPLEYSFSDKIFVGLLSPGARFKLPVPKLYQPVAHNAASSVVLQKLYDEFEAFRVILDYADLRQLEGLHVSSPAGGARPSILAYLDATTQHNKYHWQQIEALLKNPKFPVE